MKAKPSITIRDVAKRAGVSIATVSRYINKTAPVSQEVGEVIQISMQELQFIPNSAAVKLAKKEYYTIGLLLSDIKGDYFSVLMSEIEREARKAGFDTLISINRETNKTTTHAFPIGPQNTDGIIIFADSASDNDLKYFYFNSYPVVLICRSSPPEISIPSVMIENLSATKNILRHLIEVHQRRKIVYLRGSPMHEDSLAREKGYRMVLAEKNIPYNSSLVVDGDFDRDTAYASMKKLIKRNVPFDAVFASDDEAAVGAMAALNEEGFDIPKQVSVVGFDDQSTARFLNPPLTTVHAPFQEVSQKAVEILLKQINHQSVELSTILPSELIIRHSCGC